MVELHLTRRDDGDRHEDVVDAQRLADGVKAEGDVRRAGGHPDQHQRRHQQQEVSHLVKRRDTLSADQNQSNK